MMKHYSIVVFNQLLNQNAKLLIAHATKLIKTN